MTHRIISRREWLRNAILAAIFMLGLGLSTYALWEYAPKIFPEVFSQESILLQLLVVFLLSLLFLFALVFLGSIAEYMRLKPGVVVMALSAVIVAIFAYVLNITFNMWIMLLLAYLLVLFYVYVSE